MFRNILCLIGHFLLLSFLNPVKIMACECGNTTTTRERTPDANFEDAAVEATNTKTFEFRVLEQYASQYGYGAKHSDIEAELHLQEVAYSSGPNFPAYTRGYHGFFGRAYNYAHFGYGLVETDGRPLYSGLKGLYN